ncbi:hypothetical protein DSL72_007487 [Monilinia vaccinii-corymbosi]|uniref:C2 NT-type domain-containing protein n=1 Tax=Monilinia vaccinii-corymbosi TaxID=61207 RepID=A0A8A3PHW9_9HELO|nr:hypothetical protein DSL72_007487 [Monilinia vaccinii-corymbosi]
MVSISRLVSKARKPKFDLTLRIIDLNNVPLTSGTAYIKWSLPNTSAAEHSGQTARSPIKEHKVTWDYTRTLLVRLTIDKNNQLSECLLHLDIIQEYNSGQSAKGERDTLGHITLNLAEYVEESEVEGEEGVVRRYLLQESKINSTAKIGIAMRQVEGERNFVAPVLKSAPVFGGIAGIMKGENGEGDDETPQLQKTSDRSDLQDMYRLSLAASWSASPFEMTADECIEDIFAGGDGWKRDSEDPSQLVDALAPRIVHDELSPGGSGVGGGAHRRNRSDASQRSNITVASMAMGGKSGAGAGAGKEHRGHRHKKSSDTTRSAASGSGSAMGMGMGMGMNMSLHLDEEGLMPGEKGRQGRSLGHIPGMGSGGGGGHPREVDEFDIRDDLVAWSLPGWVS